MKNLSPGDSFGDYVVVRSLGKGGMGEVWLLSSQNGTEVAAKILDGESSGDHEARRRFLREAQLAIGIRHPHLVEAYDVGEDPETGLCYILMEYVPGGTLADRIKANGALPIDEATSIVKAIASVLEVGRQKGIVHRDIKPANIMFSADGTPKLADLGIARGKASDAETTTVTQTGVMIGTPAYMAPEQMLDAHNVDTRADIYSLGVVFFEMLTGERPNKDDTVIQLLAKAVQGEPLPDVRTLRPEVSASIAQLLNMMVVPDREGRISTPGQIESAIDTINRTNRFEAPIPVRCPRTTAVKPTHTAANPPRRPSLFPRLLRSAIPFLILGGLAAAMFVLAPKKTESPREASVKKTIVKTNIVDKVVDVAKVVTNEIERSVTVENREPVNPAQAVPDDPFLKRSRHRGDKPAPGWITVEPNALIDVKMTAESVLSGDGDVSRAICLYYPLENQYQRVRWYGEAPSDDQVAVMPQTRDRYIRLADKGRHLPDVDESFEFVVKCNKVKIDFSKIDGTVPYDKTTFEYKTYTRDWFDEGCNPRRVSVSDPWVIKNRDEILFDVGDDHIDYAYLAYRLVLGKFSLDNRGGDISGVIESGRGCGRGLSSLYVSLLRSAGIPARTLCGKKDGLHNPFIPEFYLEGCGWIPADLLRDIGSGRADHFGVYDLVCPLVNSDLGVSVAGARGDGDECRFDRFFMAWWWWVSGWWTPCETQLRWHDRVVSKAEVAKRLKAPTPPQDTPRKTAGKPTTAVVFPILDRDPNAWAYSFDEERKWNDSRFDDSKWKRAPGGFGYREDCKQLHSARLNTIWRTTKLFLRKRFRWSGGEVSRVVVDAYHDDDMTIWLNGRLMLTVNGSNSDWQPFEIPAKRFARALRRGENVFCVEVRQCGCAQYFDCGLLVECGGEMSTHAGPDGVHKIKTAEGTWTVVVEDGVAQIGNGRDIALDPAPRGTLKVPAELGGMKIRKLARDCFGNCHELECVVIPEGVRSIGRGAFVNCSRLARIDLPESLEHIGLEAMQDDRCLRRIDLKNVRLIEGGVFRWCGALNAVTVSADNVKFRSKDGILYDRARRAVVFCPRSRTSFSFPSGVEEVYPGAFTQSAVKRAVFPSTVKFVGYDAFDGCRQLESVVFKGDDAIILGGAFASTPSLRKVALPPRLKFLDDWAIFAHAVKLEKIVLPDTLEIIDDAVFEDCQNLKHVELGKSLRTLRHHAFSHCRNLKKVTLPATLKEMGSEVFRDCRELESVTFLGDAPILFDQGADSLGRDLYRETDPKLTTFVRSGSTGWKDGTDALPEKWPVEGGENARRIRHLK